MPERLDLIYGDAPRTKLDFFATNGTGAATLLFFHGGYWQRNAKEGFSFVAEGPLAHGFHVAVAGYTLAPEATMHSIVREARTAMRWLHQNLATLGGDPTRLYVSGWSAGGHLTAMLMDEAAVAGSLAVSGLFDLEGPAKEGPIKFLAPMVTPGHSAVLRAADHRRQFLVPVVVGRATGSAGVGRQSARRRVGRVVTEHIAAFTPPKGARALLPAAKERRRPPDDRVNRTIPARFKFLIGSVRSVTLATSAWRYPRRC